MKRNLLFVAMSVLLLSFDNHGTVAKSAGEVITMSTGLLLKWDDLPDKYKDAPRTGQAETASNIPGSTVVETFGPYGRRPVSGSTMFNILPPAGSVILAIGLGVDTVSSVKHITVWYKNPAGNIVKAQAGKLMQYSTISFLELGTEEYIKFISGSTREGIITGLTIKTNKNRFVQAGRSTTNRLQYPFSDTCKIGFQVFGFWGYESEGKIDQINFNEHCKPWTVQPGSDAKDIAVAADGSAYMINSVGKFFKLPASGTSWISLPGSDGKSIAANAGRVCMVNTAGKMYELIGASWKQLPGSDGVDIAIAEDNKLWLVNTAGNVYSMIPGGKYWDISPIGGNAYRISAGKFVSALTKGGSGLLNTYSWNGSEWIYHGVVDGKDIAISNDRNWWLTNTNGIIYHYNQTTRKWDELCGSSGYTLSANNNKVMLVNSVGAIYKLTY